MRMVDRGSLRQGLTRRAAPRETRPPEVPREAPRGPAPGRAARQERAFLAERRRRDFAEVSGGNEAETSGRRRWLQSTRL